MFQRLTIHASDLAAAEAFYRAVLPVLGLGAERDQGEIRWGSLRLVQAESPREITTRLHIGLFARSRTEVDEFWRAGTAAGYHDDGEPGERPQYSPDYYGAFLRDPDDNSVEAVHNLPERPRGAIDHLWIRVTNLDAARSFYEELVPQLGIERTWTQDDPARVGFASPTGSFSVVLDGPPTEGLDVEFEELRGP